MSTGLRRTTIALSAICVAVLLSGCEASANQKSVAVVDSVVSAAPAPPPWQSTSETVEAAPAPESKPSAAASGPAPRVTQATVVRVVDGDTAVFALAGGATEKTRFIGIDTPESTTQIEEYGKEASAYTKRALPAGRKVWLERDVEERDKYGRLLAYVWLQKPGATSESEIRAKMLNARIALDGYAQQMTIQPNSKYADSFRVFVREARESGKGLWAGELEESAPAAVSSGGGASAAYIGNRNTHKFHEPSCSSVGEMNPANQVALSSRNQATDEGYVPCKRCDP